jgi:hypothetical protein
VLEQLAEKKIGNRFAGLEIGTELSQHHREDLHIHGHDGRTIPYQDKTFDLVYATHCLNTLPMNVDFSTNCGAFHESTFTLT